MYIEPGRIGTNHQIPLYKQWLLNGRLNVYTMPALTFHVQGSNVVLWQDDSNVAMMFYNKHHDNLYWVLGYRTEDGKLHLSSTWHIQWQDWYQLTIRHGLNHDLNVGYWRLINQDRNDGVNYSSTLGPIDVTLLSVAQLAESTNDELYSTLVREWLSEFELGSLPTIVNPTEITVQTRLRQPYRVQMVANHGIACVKIIQVGAIKPWDLTLTAKQWRGIGYNSLIYRAITEHLNQFIQASYR